MCPDADAWLRFLDRDPSVDLETTRSLDDHLAGCGACRAIAAALADNGTDSKSAHEADAPDPLAVLPPWAGGAGSRSGSLVAGKWQIEALLGAGGMGSVYRARHRNGHAVAIKFLHSKLVEHAEVVRRFRREGYVANRVAHPSVVTVLDDGDDGGPYLVMELLEGVSCRHRLREQGPFSVEATLDVVEAAAAGLAAAHEKGIVHRDVKPDNLFLGPGEAVRLLDFGLAALRGALDQDSVTVEGITMGTVGFMAPEQARGDNAAVGPASDVWSLAATGLTLRTGRTVHGGATPAEQLAFAVTRPAPKTRSFASGFTPAVEALFDRALAFESNRRPADAGAFLVALRAARLQRSPGLRRFAASIVALVVVSASSTWWLGATARAPLVRAPVARMHRGDAAHGSVERAPAPASTEALAGEPDPVSSLHAQRGAILPKRVPSAAPLASLPPPRRDPLAPRR